MVQEKCYDPFTGTTDLSAQQLGYQSSFKILLKTSNVLWLKHKQQQQNNIVEFLASVKIQRIS